MASLSIILYDAYTFSSNIQQTYLFRSSALIPLKNLIKPLKHIMMTSHYLNQWWLDYRRIYASFGPNELNCPLFSAYSYQPSHCIKILRDGSDYISKWHLINQFLFCVMTSWHGDPWTSCWTSSHAAGDLRRLDASDLPTFIRVMMSWHG